MSLDDDIRRSLQGHAEDVTPARGAWSAVEKKVRRARAQRLAAYSTMAIALIVAGFVIAMPHLRDSASQEPGFLSSSPPTAQPSYSCDPPNACASASPAPVASHRVFRDETAGYQLTLPEGWRVAVFEGTAELLPPDQAPLEKGQDTFAVAASKVDALPSSGLATQNESLSNGGRRETHYFGFLDAAPDCPRGAPCPAVNTYIRVAVTASTAALWNEFGSAGQAVADSTVDAQKVSPDLGTEVVTARGGVNAAVSYDATTATLVRFLEARVDGAGAERWIVTGNEAYAPGNADALPLYGYQSYTVTRRTDQPNGVVTFRVELTREHDKLGSSPAIEEITLSPYVGGNSGSPPIVVSGAAKAQ